MTNWGSYYKLRQPLLQIRAAITNCGINWPSFILLENPSEPLKSMNFFGTVLPL